MSIYVDTSALIAVLDAADRHHQAAATTWTALVSGNEPLLASNYVLLETAAIVQRRSGLASLSVLERGIVPVLTIIWVTEAVHQAAVNAVLMANRRDLSLVDCISFTLLQNLGINRVFTFDPHFQEQGFQCLP